MEQKLCMLILISLALLIRCINANDHSDTASEGTANAAKYREVMYNFLRDLALPVRRPKENIDQRFILQVSIESCNCKFAAVALINLELTRDYSFIGPCYTCTCTV